MECKVENCDRPAKYAGLCGMHYKRKWRHGNPETTLITMHQGEVCSVEGCDNPATDKTMCKLCAQKFRRYGRTYNIVDRGSNCWVDSAGYLMLLIEGRRVHAHVYLAEQALGKPLPKGAIVHHTRGLGDMLEPFDLVICPDQAYHLLLHRRMKELGYGQDN